MRKRNVNMQRGLFQLGLLFSLSLTLVAFEWSQTGRTSLFAHPLQQDEVLLPEPAPLPPQPRKPEPAKSAVKNEQTNKIQQVQAATEFVQKKDETESDNKQMHISNEEQGDLNLEFGTSDAVIDAPPMNPDELDIQPYFPQMKQTSFKERFEASKKEINAIIQKNIRTPSDVKEAGKNQQVVVIFTVNNKGEVGETFILNSKKILASIVDECKRLIDLIPDMQPGYNKGKAVKTIFRIPITFIVE